jgi:hypothetical protein
VKRFIIAWLLMPIAMATWYLLEILDISLDIRSIVLIVTFIVSCILFITGLISIVKDSKKC